MEVYVACYHSNPGAHVDGASGQFLVVENAMARQEWPYDNGDDPSFYQARRGHALTWGVRRQNVRNAIAQSNDAVVVVFISFTRNSSEIIYRLTCVATVAEAVDWRVLAGRRTFQDAWYINTLIMSGDGGRWQYDEQDRPNDARHESSWLWRIANHERFRRKRDFNAAYAKVYRRGYFSERDIARGVCPPMAENYIVFSKRDDETFIAPTPPVVAIAVAGDSERWVHATLEHLVLETSTWNRNGKARHLRSQEVRGHQHPHLHWTVDEETGKEWRKCLIAALREASMKNQALGPIERWTRAPRSIGPVRTRHQTCGDR